MKSGFPKESLKKTFLCECTESVFVAADTISLEFIWPGPVPKGGQFFLVKPRRTGVFLARPLSVAGWRPRKHTISGRNTDRNDRRQKFDRRRRVDTRVKFERRVSSDRRRSFDRRGLAGGIVRFLVTRRGQGSRDIVDMRPGEEAELTGPLGNFWPVDEIPKGHVALIAGGVGIAPLLAVIRDLGRRTYDIYAGFRSASFGLEYLNPKARIIASEDGSEGVKGRIPDFFTPSGYRGVFACGPEPMLKAVGDICIAAGVPCYISVERRMACGVGACLGCKVKTTRGSLRCCADGPIFPAEEVCFDD